MKLWEVMKLLEENPRDVYEAKMDDDWKYQMTVEDGFGGYYHFDVFKGKELIDQSIAGGAFNGNVALNLDWQLVREPVTWQEAIQAWSVGKRVKVSTIQRDYVFSQIEKMEVLPMMIQDGIWYVED